MWWDFLSSVKLPGADSLCVSSSGTSPVIVCLLELVWHCHVEICLNFEKQIYCNHLTTPTKSSLTIIGMFVYIQYVWIEENLNSNGRAPLTLFYISCLRVIPRRKIYGSAATPHCWLLLLALNLSVNLSKGLKNELQHLRMPKHAKKHFIQNDVFLWVLFDFALVTQQLQTDGMKCV